MDVRSKLKENAALVEAELSRVLARDDIDFYPLLNAERYSITAGGKRIRPFLVLEACRMLGGSDKAALPFAAAVEMVHTYSLIHDDLPAMDNDDLRRGRPTCHKAFDEATALLAGDGLLTRAFAVLAGNTEVSDATARAAVAVLAEAAGSFGMIGGQNMDLKGEKQRLTLEELLKLHANKTGALISVSTKLGCLAAGRSLDDAVTKSLVSFAADIGLAFQVIDDVLDAVSDTATLGKTVGKDAKASKTTFLTYYSIDEAKAYATELTERAKQAIAGLEGNEVLLAFADYLTERKF